MVVGCPEIVTVLVGWGGGHRFSDPDADRGRAKCGVHDSADTFAERDEIDFVPKALREVVRGSLGVVSGPVEAVVDPGLDAPPERLEQGRGEEGRAGDGQRLALGHAAEHALQQEDRRRRRRQAAAH